MPALRWHRHRCAPAGGDVGRFWVGTATDVDAEISAVEALTHDNRELEQDIFTQLHELNRSRSRLQTIFDACPDHLSLLRLSKDGAVTFEDVNPAAAALYACSRAEIVGRPIHDVVGVEPAVSLEAHIRETLRDGRLSYELERHDDGQILPSISRWWARLLPTPARQRGWCCFAGETSPEQRAAEEALRQSQKMEAVGQLTGGLAHDFNNLLTAIMGSLDLLQTRVKEGRYDRIDRYVTGAQEAAERAAALTHRLLAFLATPNARSHAERPQYARRRHGGAGSNARLDRRLRSACREPTISGPCWSMSASSRTRC